MPKPKFDFTPKLRNDITTFREYVAFRRDLIEVGEVVSKLKQTAPEVYAYHRLLEKLEDAITDQILDFDAAINVDTKPKGKKN